MANIVRKNEMPRKAEKQYQELKSRFKVTRREFLDYYNAVRKANKKTSSKSYKERAFLPKTFSTKVGFIQTRKIFLNMSKNVTEVLSKDFLKEKNQEARNNVYANLNKLLGEENSKQIIEKFEEDLKKD